MYIYRIELDGATVETVEASNGREALAMVGAENDPAFCAVRMLGGVATFDGAYDHDGLIVDAETAAYQLAAINGHNFGGALIA